MDIINSECCRRERGLSLKQDEFQALQDLGLTLSQAKVYVTLVTIGSLTARQASRFAKVARQDIYRILTELRHRGLVEKIITTPTKFAAVPIQDAISILLERRIKETSELQERTRELIQRVGPKVKTTVLEENEHFVLIPEKEALIRRLKNAISTAKESIDVISSGTVFPLIIFVLAENIKEAITNGVEIRYIIHKPEESDPLPESVIPFTKNPAFKLRTLPDPPDTRCGIFDKKEVFIATYPSRGAFQSPALWSTNSSLITAIQDHFDKKWTTAIKIKP